MKKKTMFIILMVISLISPMFVLGQVQSEINPESLLLIDGQDLNYWEYVAQAEEDRFKQIYDVEYWGECNQGCYNYAYNSPEYSSCFQKCTDISLPKLGDAMINGSKANNRVDTLSWRSWHDKYTEKSYYQENFEMDLETIANMDSNIKTTYFKILKSKSDAFLKEATEYNFKVREKIGLRDACLDSCNNFTAEKDAGNSLGGGNYDVADQEKYITLDCQCPIKIVDDEEILAEYNRIQAKYFGSANEAYSQAFSGQSYEDSYGSEDSGGVSEGKGIPNALFISLITIASGVVLWYLIFKFIIKNVKRSKK